MFKSLKTSISTRYFWHAISQKITYPVFQMEGKHILITFRIVITLLLVSFIFINEKGILENLDLSSPVFQKTLLLITLHFFSNILLIFLSQNLFKPWLFVSLFFGDITIISMVFYLVQGFVSDIFLIYFLVIFMTLLARRVSFSFLVAGLACCLYGYLYSKTHGLGDLFQPWIMIRFSVLIIVAFFSSTIIEQIEGEQRALEAKHQKQQMEAIERMAGGVAHGFNNMLTAIQGYCLMLMTEFKQTDPKYADLLEIKKAADRTAALTQQLLAFSQQQMLSPQIINLNELLLSMDKELRQELKQKIEFQMKLAPDLKLLEADPLQIKQVITNLVLHGQDSLTQGGRILIETTNVVRNTTDVRNANGLKPGGYVLLSISDTGPGMDLEKQSHIFEPFFSLKDQTAIDNIGLATVYGIVKQSGADILVHSQVGRGTTFQIYFPQVQLPEQKIQETATKTKTPYGLKTIVVVDDEDMVRRLAVRILKKEAYHVLEASSPMEAISVCNRYTATIHLLLTDVIMPQMNGKQLADQIRILHPETKVLFMSGYTDKAVIAQEILKSNIDFIQKPFSPEALSRKTSEVLHTQS